MTSDPQSNEVDESELRDEADIGRAMRGSLIVLVVLALIGGVAAYVLTRPKAAPPVRESKLAAVAVRERPMVQVPTTPFTDITEEAGISFVHNNGATGDKLLPETMGGGSAFLDFDNDGDQDLLLINSMDWSWDEPSDRGNTSALYRNEGGKFVDVTKGSGLDVELYGMGVAVGDYDQDGLVDVFISAVGTNRLFRNVGEGKFEDTTETAGVGGEEDRWSTSSGWFDYDNDGDLDLFVCNYVGWSREYDQSQGFQLVGGGRAYGRPQNFEGTFPYLYRNDGDGEFTDVSEEAGIQIRNVSTNVPQSKSLGLALCDFDRNGFMDVVVANDTVQNCLLRNGGDGKFTEMGAICGIAFDSSGNARGAMGIDVTSFREQSSVAVAIGNFSNEMTALYVTKAGRMQFYDEAISTGLGPSTRLLLTFGLAYVDYDLDGRLDLFCANGHLEEDINRVQPSQHYEQPPQMFWNAGPEFETEFLPVGKEQLGEDFVEPMVGRGASYADVDLDGDLDLLITSAGRAPRLLRNDQETGHHWLRLKLVGDGEKCNRDAIGAWVSVTVGDEVIAKQVMPTRSYLTQVELPLTFGLGEHDSIDNVSVQWPDGEVVEIGPVEIDQSHEITR
ncbi:MAG TPA: CRTAC1 family protein [Rhodopirellula baltica]|uniref:ASPIC/UnbV domain-containing protein n=2 Tax=Rhodopirellula baltica TaxID=265606 RepID=K5EFF1_RHOBT|nr:CRTAC1 family protein [Rhodopirellula baltica]EKK04626.1 ASPIC/UnbV domain-containing protein [Rhodopirellula baltica SH28]CAD77154.1 similar to ASPIC [Rhodopirellula baltica SH 1]HBE63683.1 CRTAC1 family protein [Rhodopirellula baltica]